MSVLWNHLKINMKLLNMRNLETKLKETEKLLHKEKDDTIANQERNRELKYSKKANGTPSIRIIQR